MPRGPTILVNKESNVNMIHFCLSFRNKTLNTHFGLVSISHRPEVCGHQTGLQVSTSDLWNPVSSGWGGPVKASSSDSKLVLKKPIHATLSWPSISKDEKSAAINIHYNPSSHAVPFMSKAKISLSSWGVFIMPILFQNVVGCKTPTNRLLQTDKVLEK